MPNRSHDPFLTSFLDSLTEASSDPITARGHVIAGRYRIEDCVGRGGMGSVYRAFDQQLERQVALKIIHASQARTPSRARRFRREMRATARVNHPNGVRLYDYGCADGGRVFLAMELVEGRSLTPTLVDGPLPPERAAWIIAQVARYLASLHAKGIVHLDIKLANIMLCDRQSGAEVVKVVDLGIARFLNDDDDGVTEISQAGEVLGTPAYMSPEQIRQQDIDHRTDIYALGAVFYALLTGHHAYEGKPAQVIWSQLHRPPPVPTELYPHLPSWTDELVARMMATRPCDRFGSAAEVVDFVERVTGIDTNVTSSAPLPRHVRPLVDANSGSFSVRTETMVSLGLFACGMVVGALIGAAA